MPRQNLSPDSIPHPVARTLARLGGNIALARARRGLRQVDVAQKTGLALGTVRRIEAGSPTTAIGAYFTVLWAFGLEREFVEIAAPERDEEGKTRERARAPQRVRIKEDLDADF